MTRQLLRRAMKKFLEIQLKTRFTLGQERLYVAFCDRTWILDAGEREG
jgi:hypothetical protein